MKEKYKGIFAKAHPQVEDLSKTHTHLKFCRSYTHKFYMVADPLHKASFLLTIRRGACVAPQHGSVITVGPNRSSPSPSQEVLSQARREVSGAT